MSLINLQKKIGVTADGAFGPGTFKRASAFYKLSPNRAAHFFALRRRMRAAASRRSARTLTTGRRGFAASLVSISRLTSKRVFTNASRRRLPIVSYANRMGNGPEGSGDGWKYRGRGALQLTGKDNYQAFAN